MLHGIYGRGRNLQAVARAVVAARSEYACWLVDLPYHGESGPAAHGQTVAGLASDVIEWMRVERITVNAILGHSYGGKVALSIADTLRDQPLQVWVIDSTPEVKEPSGSAWGMLELVRALPARFPTRDAAVAAISEAGYDLAVAQWMSTNLVREAAGFVWQLDFDVMEQLLRDFFSADLWHTVESDDLPHDLHFLKASRSSAISDEAVRRLEAAGNRVHVHHREGGHWIHAESPDIVATLLVEHI
jgi:pimeloyl-ACP methyl ester carboxylesterase